MPDMLELLLAVLLVKILRGDSEEETAQKVADRALAIGAGLDYQQPEPEEKPRLYLVR